MSRMTSGVLCRDSKGYGQWIHFFPDQRHEVDHWRGFAGRWDWAESGYGNRSWSLATWNKLYQLYDEHGNKIPPPKPGKCYEIEIEL